MISFFLEFLFWFWSIFIFVGAIGGWFVIVALLAREKRFAIDRADIERATHSAFSEPQAGHVARRDVA